VEGPVDDGSVWRCEAGALTPGRTAKFRLIRWGKPIDGFIVSVDGGYRAYVNRCPHAGSPLDQWPNEFMTEDGRYLICSTHGAIFEPRTGICVEGPCPGAALDHLTVEMDGGSLVVRWPS
jgi:nitrite reductase/ring-hydroxylating ferredoxin subunit